MANSNDLKVIENMHKGFKQKLNDPDVCANLALDESTSRKCAQLEVIYNKLTNTTSGSNTGLYNTECKSVKDAMETLRNQYETVAFDELIDKYQEIFTNLIDAL